ncbi:MAG: T9SS type A sorting domain-containing protein [Bacteroidota bacterium]
MKTKLLSLGILTLLSAAMHGQMINNFEPGSPTVTATYGAEFSAIANPLTTGNTTATVGQIKRTGTNWYELIRFNAVLTVPANTTKYVHMLVRYTSATVPNLSIRLDAVGGNDGGNSINPLNPYNAPGTWKDLVFKVEGGESGITTTELIFIPDASVNVLNNTDSFAQIDEILLNDSETPIGYEPEDMMLNDFETGSPTVTASYGAEFNIVANPLTTGNATANVGQIKRTTGNWYELVRYTTYFNIPANTTRYIHVLARYTSAIVPNMSIRIDANSGNDGTTDIHPSVDYTNVGGWQDMVFAIPGGENGISVTQIVFLADSSFDVLNSTDSFAYIDEMMINDEEDPAPTASTAVFANNNSIVAYPNPSQNVWNFASSVNNITSIQITDMLGKTVISQNLEMQNATVDASGLSKGIYFAKVSTGNATQIIKIIKE